MGGSVVTTRKTALIEDIGKRFTSKDYLEVFSVLIIISIILHFVI
jgi:hypothetical protein